MFRFIVLSLLTSPLLSFAQTLVNESGGQQTAQGFIRNFVLFLNGTIVPFLLGIAFLIFVINVVRFFVFQSNNEDGQKAAKALATYSVLAFVIILIFWGLVNMLSSSLNLTTGGAPVSDYVNQDQAPGTVPPPRQPTAPGSGAAGNTNTQSGASNNSNSRPTSNNPSSQSTPNFAPPASQPIQPPPISSDLPGAPDPSADPFTQGGPAQADIPR